MGWAVGYDSNWKRDIGYGVPANCDYPGCQAVIDRGLAYVCCGQEPYGGEGCGLFFCEDHADSRHRCERCDNGEPPFDPSPDRPEWIEWKLTHESWQRWRDENPSEVTRLQASLSQTVKSDSHELEN